jgi:hypothetical protein
MDTQIGDLTSSLETASTQNQILSDNIGNLELELIESNEKVIN